ncbi:hypothetical protein GCM10020366_53680 [Saccharopolyspora gregorii]|uniref:Uncharacterized protein n=1 Tax=Saccharopolyspora gregorii TaxID=33914 RepID=A0ABP6RY75_9PSEU
MPLRPFLDITVPITLVPRAPATPGVPGHRQARAPRPWTAPQVVPDPTEDRTLVRLAQVNPGQEPAVKAFTPKSEHKFDNRR